MLRVELEAEDLGRIRFADAPAPVLETVLMLFELRQGPLPGGSGHLGGVGRPAWRDAARATFSSSARPLLQLVPSRTVALYLDVLTPDAQEAFEVVVGTPQSVHEDNLARITRDAVPVPSWLHRYTSNDPGTLHDLDHALRAFHAACLAPRWSSVVGRFHHDLVERTALLRRHGVAAMLNTISPDLRLNGLTLEGRYPRERRVRPGGQGLVLMPSAFWTGYPLITWDPQDRSRYVLIYPAHPGPAGGLEHGSAVAGRGGGDTLAALLGPTRAGVLRALHRPRTTTALAHQAGISLSSASEHAATLRAAGLITSDRHGQAIVHRVSELGSALLSRGSD